MGETIAVCVGEVLSVSDTVLAAEAAGVPAGDCATRGLSLGLPVAVTEGVAEAGAPGVPIWPTVPEKVGVSVAVAVAETVGVALGVPDTVVVAGVAAGDAVSDALLDPSTAPCVLLVEGAGVGELVAVPVLEGGFDTDVEGVALGDSVKVGLELLPASRTPEI